MKPYLVTIAGLRGPEHQIWYKDDRRFVGPPLVPLAQHELPEGERWTVAAARDFVRAKVEEIA